MEKKILKLINDERTSLKINSAKACSVQDSCVIDSSGICQVYDVCYKDGHNCGPIYRDSCDTDNESMDCNKLQTNDSCGVDNCWYAH